MLLLLLWFLWLLLFSCVICLHYYISNVVIQWYVNILNTTTLIFWILQTNYNKAVVLIFHEFSKASSHNILIHHLENWVGLFETVFNFPPSYITDKKMFMSCGASCIRNVWHIFCGVTQGSCPSPLLFSLDMLLLASIVR